MDMRDRVAQGIQAGLLAGVTVAVVFFVADLVRLAPIAVPASLQQTFLGPGGTFLDFPVEARALAIFSFVVRFLSFTIIHLLAFAVLGVGAALVLCGRPLGACAWSGACYGVVVCSAVFYGSLVVTGAHLVAEVPGFLAVLGVNLLAGAVMGAYLGLGRPAT